MATRKATKRSTKTRAKRAKAASVRKGKAAKPTAKRRAKPVERAPSPKSPPPRKPAPFVIHSHERVQAGLEALRQRLQPTARAGGKRVTATRATERRRADIAKALKELNEAYARLLGR